MYIAKNIRYLRKLHNLSQEDLASMFGYKSFTTIQKWESGDSDPPIATVNALAQFFKVNIDELVKTDLELNEADNNAKYYIEDETASKAQNLFESDEMRLLFDAAQNSKPEDLQMAADLLLRLKGTNPDG